MGKINCTGLEKNLGRLEKEKRAKINYVGEVMKSDFLIDNNIVFRFSPDTKTDEIWPFDKPFYLILNLAIGGRFGGFEIDDSIFPQEFIIDYVKVYKRN